MSEALLPQLRLAWRSLWRSPRRTRITLASIALGLAQAIFFGSLSHGSYRRVIDDATRLLPGQLIVERTGFADDPRAALSLDGAPALRERLSRLPFLREARARISAQGVIGSGHGSVGVGISGIEPGVEGRKPPAGVLVAGRLLVEGDDEVAVIGAGLAQRLRLEPGSQFTLTVVDAQGHLSGNLLRLVGVFRSGNVELDGALVLLPLRTAQEELGLRQDQVSQLGLIVDARGESGRGLGEAGLREPRARVAALLPPGLEVRTWEEAMPTLASWLALDVKMNRVLRGLIVCVVLFTILNTLLMGALERRHEFAVLLAIGTSPRSLRLQLLLEVVLLAALGCALGALLGAAAGGYGEVHGIDFTPLMKGKRMAAGPMVLDPLIHCDLAWDRVAEVTALVFAATVALGLFPMAQATRLDLPGTLRALR